MRTRTWLAVAAIMTLGLAFPGVSQADRNAEGCIFDGTWFGYNPGTGTLTGWVVTVAGMSSKAGTNNLEHSLFDPTFNGVFPTAERLSTLRGAWVRTGGNTFDFTMIGMALDAARQPVWVGKLTGHIIIDDGCMTETIEGTRLEIFAPDQNPYTGIRMELPYGLPNPIPLPTHFGFRARVDLPEEE